MALRIFVVNNTIKEDVAKVVRYALRPENLYVPGPDTKMPGDDPGHVYCQDGYRIVFSLTRMSSTRAIYRHLSLALDTKGAFPDPALINQVLDLFGFMGGLPNCFAYVDRSKGCFIFVQTLPN